MAHRIHLTLAFALLAIALTLLSLHFFDWPPNRDLTTYATIARELRQGETLYVDVWDIKPPAIFLVYGLAQATIESPPLQFFILRLVPSLLVLAALVRAGRDAGFGDVAGVVSGLFWVVLSGDVRYQMHEANTEVFINACVAWAFVLFLRLQVGSALWLSLAIGLLFAVATLFKTVALAIAGLLGVAHLACPPSKSAGPRRSANCWRWRPAAWPLWDWLSSISRRPTASRRFARSWSRSAQPTLAMSGPISPRA